MSGLIDITEDNFAVGPWRKKKNLGRGGFGVVSLWENEIDGCTLAVKTCLRGSKCSISKKQKERWTNEVEIMRKLDHPNIVKSLPIPEELSQLNLELPLLCMEYCMLGDLRKQLIKPENCCGFPEEDVRAIINDVKSAVQYLHKFKIIHRDLKPENIVLQNESPYKVIYKLIDLGYAKEVDQNSLCSSFVGTFQYLAPELFTQQYSCSVDYWSFGLVCHEVITGFRPFLPQMLPTKWMGIVEKKSTEDICIYESSDGTIVYSQQMFPENHISQPLRYAIEKWLTLALEWNGEKRGKSHDNKLILFSELDLILAKKVVTVFSASAFLTLSYEIDDSTLVGTLKQWIQRDTKQLVFQQMVLLPSGEILEDSAIVHHHWNPQNQMAMLYIFDKDGFYLPKETPRLPVLVLKIMESPTSPMSYPILKRAFACAVFYIQTIKESYTMLLEAYAVKMLSMLVNNQLITKIEQETNRELNKVCSRYKLFKESLQYDLDRAAEMSNLVEQEITAKWKSNCKVMDEKVIYLTEVSKRLSSSVGSAVKKVANVQNFEDPGTVYQEELDKLLNVAYNVYSSFRGKSAEEREKSWSPNSMVQVIFLCIKICSEMLKDEPFSQHLLEVYDCEKSLLCLISPLKSFKQHLSKFYEEVIEKQISRQKDIWDTLSKCRKVTAPTRSTSFHLHETRDGTHSPVFFRNSVGYPRSSEVTRVTDPLVRNVPSPSSSSPAFQNSSRLQIISSTPQRSAQTSNHNLDEDQLLSSLRNFGLDLDG